MFADDMASHRQNTILTPLFGFDRPSGQMVGVARKGRGYEFDFSRFDRWVEIFFDRGFRLIEGGHIASKAKNAYPVWLTDDREPDRGPGGKRRKEFLVPPAGHKEWQVEGNRLTFKSARDPRFTDFLTSFFRAIWEHLGKRGWQDRYLQHVSDEPRMDNFKDYRRLAGIVRAAAPGIRIIDAVGDPEYAHLMEAPVPIESVYDRMAAESGRSREDIWMYYCCGPGGQWPNRFIEYNLVRVRIFTWLCFVKGIPGFLHWGYNYWSSLSKQSINPWDDTTANRWPGGDPMMVYPPRDKYMARDKVIDSIRWEIVREAMEDYEYLRMVDDLAEKGDREAKALLAEVRRKVVPDWTTHTRDYRYLLSVRERMGDIIERSR